MKTSTCAKRTVVLDICKPYYLQIVVLSILTILESVCQVALAIFMRFVIDSAVSKDGSLALWSGVLAGDIIALVVLHCWISWLRGSAADRFSGSLRQDILQSALCRNESKLRQVHSGILLSRGMEDVHTVCDGVIQALPTLIGQIARLVAAFVAVLLIYPPLAIILLIAAGAVGLVAACLRPILRKHHRLVRKTDETVMAAMQEDFQQLELIQGLQIQKPVLQRFSGHIKANLAQKGKRRLWSVGSNGMVHALMQVGAGVLLLWGATQLSAEVLSYGTLFSMLQLATLFRAPALGISALWTRLAAIDVAAERLQDLLKPADAVSVAERDLSVSAIVFENVTFTYPGDELPAIEDLNIYLPLDGWTCLTGFSGKGKSTVFKLILGLYTPQKGRVYLQTNKGQLPCDQATRSLFAYVPQDYALFSGTVLENLQLVAPDAEDGQLQAALAAAKATFVLEMCHDIHTQVGENNTGLSMGQLQRIAIARAILMDRPIFLLDECTSALDAETEKAVLEGLRATGRQALLVTHRPEALEDISGICTVSMES